MIFLRYFLRGLGAMLPIGIPLTRALQVLAEQQEEAWARGVVERIFVRISSGQSLSEAMKKESPLFGAVVLNLVVLGEETSSLASNFEKAAQYIEESFAFKSKIYSSLT